MKSDPYLATKRDRQASRCSPSTCRDPVREPRGRLVYRRYSLSITNRYRNVPATANADGAIPPARGLALSCSALFARSIATAKSVVAVSTLVPAWSPLLMAEAAMPLFCSRLLRRSTRWGPLDVAACGRANEQANTPAEVADENRQRCRSRGPTEQTARLSPAHKQQSLVLSTPTSRSPPGWPWRAVRAALPAGSGIALSGAGRGQRSRSTPAGVARARGRQVVEAALPCPAPRGWSRC